MWEYITQSLLKFHQHESSRVSLSPQQISHEVSLRTALEVSQEEGRRPRMCSIAELIDSRHLSTSTGASVSQVLVVASLGEASPPFQVGEECFARNTSP